MGSIANKYRVHEVAKDFGVSTKEITEILTKYAETPKNHMQVLEDRELSLIFEYLTQHNPVSSIAVIFAEGAKPEEKKAEKPAAKPAQNASAPTQGQGQSGRPQQGGAPKAEQPKQPMSRVPQRQVVDTRKATNVNLDKYDEKLQDMADARSSGKRDQQAPQGKEKFRSNKQRRDNNFASNKRKQEEADRLRKLRLEVIKKTPVTVQIPDEISVGELASRMKKTGAEVVKCLMKNGVMASLSQMIDFDTAAIIAEDLGFLTPGVIDMRDNSGFPGMKILQFAFEGTNSYYLPHNYIANTVAYVGTHDNETARGWFEGTATPRQREQTALYTHQQAGEPITDALNRTIAASVSDTCIYTMQDLLNLGNEARINTPATLGGNWTWRMLDGAITRELEHKLTDWTETYFRIPSEAEIELPQ